jgi:hypothetical protein
VTRVYKSGLSLRHPFLGKGCKHVGSCWCTLGLIRGEKSQQK